MTPRLIATDLDGTLLLSDTTVGSRTRSVLDRVRARGVRVVPVTARQPLGIAAVAAEAAFDDWAVCANGAFSWHLVEKRDGFTESLSPDTLRAVLEALSARVPEARFAVVREHGRVFVAQDGYAALAVDTDHAIPPRIMRRGDLADLAAEPCLKLVGRSPVHTPAELFVHLEGLGLDGFTPTLSGAPFVEIAAHGVTKATGLARLCADLGVRPEDVAAFGDARNDVSMLAWAGHGVAVGNAVPEAKLVADEILPGTNDDEAVADWLERNLLTPAR